MISSSTKTVNVCVAMHCSPCTALLQFISTTRAHATGQLCTTPNATAHTAQLRRSSTMQQHLLSANLFVCRLYILELRSLLPPSHCRHTHPMFAAPLNLTQGAQLGPCGQAVRHLTQTPPTKQPKYTQMHTSSPQKHCSTLWMSACKQHACDMPWQPQSVGAGGEASGCFRQRKPPTTPLQHLYQNTHTLSATAFAVTRLSADACLWLQYAPHTCYC